MTWRASISASLTAVGLALLAARPAAACEAWEACITLSNGAVFIVERRWSFGELFVGLTMLMLTLVTIIRWMYDLSREYLK